MRKNLLLVIILVILGLLAYLLFNKLSNSNGARSYDLSDRDFKVENKDDIHAFRIIQKNAPIISGEKKQDHWVVNELYRADQNVISNLLDVFSNSTMDFIPGERARSNIIDEIERIGIKVELYGKNDKKLRSYFVGGNTSNEDGTYYLMEGSQQPYVMVIPGLTGSLRNRFNLTEINIRDKVIFRDLSSKIKEIEMAYPKDKSKGFTITKRRGDYEVKKLYKGGDKAILKPNRKLLEVYFNEFNKLASEWIENEHPRRDTIESLVPFAKLTLTLDDGSQQSLSLIPMNDVLDPEVNTVDLEQLTNVERYFASTSWGDFYLVQHRLIKGLLRPYEYFYVGA